MRWRAIEISRGVFGTALLVAPGPMLRHVHHVDDDARSVLVARILGARQLGQAALSGVEPSPEVLAAGIWVDLAHAATALGLAVVDRHRASAGIINATCALGWAGWGCADLRTGSVSDPAHDRRRDQLARWALRMLPGGPVLLGDATERRRGSR